MFGSFISSLWYVKVQRRKLQQKDTEAELLHNNAVQNFNYILHVATNGWNLTQHAKETLYNTMLLALPHFFQI